MLGLAVAMARTSVRVSNLKLLRELDRPYHIPKKREPKPRKVWYTVDSPEVIAATKQFKEKHSHETK
ncbi:carbon monoxide dehydrogenase large subunit [Vibrio phage SHOU24]|uniref:carbon monoxide dehydrogenase large subunit n=1 Tax=Vibrio phage SHOU24 TaxID=1414739 RepID=UPI0003ED2095|nr:carbon monoxide dehydrogenase large subunit [Vibrio phage SHOU24]AHI61290.1 carbon monoxide dehydrogenase large subunit [Vibrio phage SHOU24]